MAWMSCMPSHASGSFVVRKHDSLHVTAATLSHHATSDVSRAPGSCDHARASLSSQKKGATQGALLVTRWTAGLLGFGLAGDCQAVAVYQDVAGQLDDALGLGAHGVELGL